MRSEMILYKSCCRSEELGQQNKSKKFLTNKNERDIIIKLLIRSGSQKRSLTTEQ